ncbi:hypothetical protein [Evansella tamaricis]|uniref:Tetratricopeptide repeat protein n=1 Tax=Evansella tamaricis TaxID=2069301 RepID=A0ABS6JJ27_9BACI|nr:hypothetical protein [Evansella tamaricis]MBU9713665.1 hypothetical protein [Evansella tamaricis]
MFSEELYQKYVDFLKENDPSRRPHILYEHYDYSGSRAHLARCLVLYFHKTNPEFINDAIAMLESAVELALEERDEDGKLDVDSIVWAYKDISTWYGTYTENREQCLISANKGIEVLKNVSDKELGFGVRGQVWFNRWMALSLLGREGEALEECKGKIHEVEIKNLNCSSNSMLYYGYLFLAQRNAQNNKYEEAIDYLLASMKYIEFQEETKEKGLKEIEEILKERESDPAECLKKLEKKIELNSSLHPAWDFN